MASFPSVEYNPIVDNVSLSVLKATKTNDGTYSHAGVHVADAAEIVAIQHYLGTNASQTTPTAANSVLQATSATVSTWTTTPTVATLTTTGALVVGTTLTVDTNTLFVDATNNRVGILTLTPAVALDVSGMISATSLAIGASSVPLSGSMLLSNITPCINFYETDGGANNKYWRLVANTEQFSLQALTDAYGGETNGILFTRSAATITTTQLLPARTILSNTTPTLDWYKTDAGSNEKYWRAYPGATTLNFETINDAYNSAVVWLKITRSGTTVTTMDYTATTHNFTGSLSVKNGGIITAYSAGDDKYMNFSHDDTNAIFQVSSGSIAFRDSTVTNRFIINGATITAEATIKPITDNAYTCGANGARWTEVWATNGTIQTSDAEEKRDILESDLGLDFVLDLQSKSWIWKDTVYKVKVGEDQIEEEVTVPHTRRHYGLLAQDVERTLNGKDFAGFIKDKETGNYALRYHELLGPIIKAIQELNAKVESLK